VIEYNIRDPTDSVVPGHRNHRNRKWMLQQRINGNEWPDRGFLVSAIRFCVDAAKAAIQCRLRDLQYDSDHHEERQMMGDAQCNLAFLRRNP
jgi:hypothetical protein